MSMSHKSCKPSDYQWLRRSISSFWCHHNHSISPCIQVDFSKFVRRDHWSIRGMVSVGARKCCDRISELESYWCNQTKYNLFIRKLIPTNGLIYLSQVRVTLKPNNHWGKLVILEIMRRKGRNSFERLAEQDLSIHFYLSFVAHWLFLSFGCETVSCGEEGLLLSRTIIQ